MVIQTNSYIVIFWPGAGALLSVLMCEHCALEKRRYAHNEMEVDCMSELTPLLSIRLMVSSSEWYLSLTDAKGPNVAHVSDIV